MPLKLNIGVSRKLGTPGYGSIGASCGLELELDAELLLRDPEALHQRAQAAYAAACRAVHEELTRRLEIERQVPAALPTPRVHRALPPGDATRVPASPAQLRLIRTLAGRRGIDPVELLRQHEGPARLEDLTRAQAGRLIDRIADRREP